MELCARSSRRPIASKTWLGFTAPEAQAAPPDGTHRASAARPPSELAESVPDRVREAACEIGRDRARAHARTVAASCAIAAMSAAIGSQSNRSPFGAESDFHDSSPSKTPR